MEAQYYHPLLPFYLQCPSVQTAPSSSYRPKYKVHAAGNGSDIAQLPRVVEEDGGHELHSLLTIDCDTSSYERQLGGGGGG